MTDCPLPPEAHPGRVTERSDPPLLGPLVLFSVLALLAGIDVANDLQGHGPGAHELLEIGIALLASVGAAVILRRWLEQRRSARVLAERLDRSEAEVGRWRAESARWRAESEEHARGLGAAIDRQFDAWQLSPAEREVALLLIKGLSLKEVAAVREGSERTARQQARAVYRKGGLAGRAELAAFFLEDLLAPINPS